jgi:NADH:ubiquinone reductase (H+-translocating)
VARNLDAELKGKPLEAFTFHDKGFVVSVGTGRGVADIADIAGITSGGRLAHVLKDAIEWEYRQSVRYLRGWDPVAGDQHQAVSCGTSRTTSAGSLSSRRPWNRG